MPNRTATAFAALLAVPAAADARSAAVTCTNPSSGTTWRIAIDYANHTVDSFPARIDDATIAWRDPRDKGHYRLDRASGALTVTTASSTGGYILHDRCRMPG